MELTDSPPHSRAARLALRQHARAVVRDRGDVASHLARLGAAMELPGAEPAQGVLADVFACLGADEALVKRAAVQLVAARLAPHIHRSFEARVSGTQLPRVTPLATRWSVLAIPSADVSTRARRVSADDSRTLAADVAAAVRSGDLPAQEAFLHHCLTCQDTLAFMLARRDARRAGVELLAAWAEVGAQLEKGVVSA